MSISTEYIIQRISPGEPSSDDVQYWLVNWNNGITGTQQYTAAASGSVLSETSGQYSATTASAAVTVQAVAYSGLTLSALNQTFYFAPTAPTSVTATYGSAVVASPGSSLVTKGTAPTVCATGSNARASRR